MIKSMEHSTLTKKKSWLRSNILSILFVGFILASIEFPAFKATLMEGLMKIGLFQPKFTEEPVQNNLNTSINSPSFQFEDKEGKLVRLSDLKGKVVFVNFWATWCPPCIAEMPSINKLHKTFSDDEKIVFLMLDMDSDRVKSTKFMTRRKYDLDVSLPAGQISSDYFSGSLPTTLVFDKYGKMVFKHEGAADYTNKGFIEFLQKLSN